MVCGADGKRRGRALPDQAYVLPDHALFSFCAVGISLFSKELVLILSEQAYSEAWLMIPFFILTQLVAFIYFSHVQVLMYNVKKSKFTFICSSSSVVVNILVAVCLVNSLGIYAILLAQFISQTTMAVLAVLMGKSAGNVDFGLKKMVFFIVQAAILMGAGMMIDYSGGTTINLFVLLAKVLVLGIGFMLFIFPYRSDLIELTACFLKKQRRRNKLVKKYKIGYTTGVFDLFHIGHLNILRRAKEQCEYLIVGVTTDETAEGYKHKKPVIPFEERCAIVEAIRYVDKVVPQTSMDKMEAYKRLQFDVLFHGSDWQNSDMYNKIVSDMATVGVEVVFIPHTDGISSTILREKKASKK